MEHIESRSNEKIKEITFLKERRERESKRLFFFEGVHLFEEYLKAGNVPRRVFVTAEAYKSNEKLFDGITDRVCTVSDGVYDKITCEQSPQGILCVSDYLPNITEDASVSGSIILESVRDTGNLGTIIRTATALGVNGITISRDCADLYSPKTVRASMGALFGARITVVDDIKTAIGALTSAGNNVYAACLYGKTKTIGSFELDSGDSFVLGNEGQGVSEATAAACTDRVIIPMSGKAESLNVAAASAIIIWEMTKRRNGRQSSD